MRFGDALRHLRELEGLGLDALAFASDLEPERLDALEREETSPDLDEIARLARVLGLQSWELVRFAELNMSASSRG